MFNNDLIILGPNFLPGVGAPQIFSAPGLAVPKTATAVPLHEIRSLLGFHKLAR